MFVKRATLSRCMSLFQTVTCTSSVSDDNAFMHVLFPAQPKEAVPLSFRRPCPVILPWGSQLLPLISFPSSYLHLPIFYLIVSYLLFPHYIIVLTHNTLIPPHASRRWVWEPLEADKFNVESRDTHYKQEKKTPLQNKAIRTGIRIRISMRVGGWSITIFYKPERHDSLVWSKACKRAPLWSSAAQYPNFLIVFYVQ